MNKLDIIELAKLITYDEFVERYCSYHLCPSIHNLQVPQTRRECYDIECDDCWKNALKNIKFKDEEINKFDEDKQNDLYDDMWNEELDTQRDLMNSTR